MSIKNQTQQENKHAESLELAHQIQQLLREIPINSPARPKLELIRQAIESGRHWDIITEDRMLTPQEAAKLLGVSRPHLVNKYIKTGLLTATMVGTHYRIKNEDLRDFMARKAKAERDTALALAAPKAMPLVEFSDDDLADL